MKSTRYSSYQPLLKGLAQAAIAHRPEGWSEGELCLGHDGPAVACRLRHSDGGPEQPAPVRVQAAAQALAQALAQDGLPWVGCRIGFFRKPVGWGVRVRITPSQGSPELDLTPDRAPPSATRPVLEAPPGVAPYRPCPHCRVDSLRFMLREAGNDHYQCERCGHRQTLLVPDFDEVAYPVMAPVDDHEGPRSVQPELQSDGRITGPDYSIHLSSPETLMYQSGNTQVPVRVVQDRERGLRVLYATRLSTVDTPFGVRMLTPREHASILQHLRQAVHLLPGRYRVE